MRFLSGSTEVKEAEKPVKLCATNSEVSVAREIFVSWDESNTGKQIAIGGSEAETLAKKELHKPKGLLINEKNGFHTQCIQAADPSQLWVDAETAKDCVSWLAIYV